MVFHQKKKHKTETCSILRIEGSDPERKNRKRGTSGKFSCEELNCNYASNYKSVVRMHKESVHDGRKRFACSHCDHKSYYKRFVQAHQRDVHSSETCSVITLESNEGEKRGRKQKGLT